MEDKDTLYARWLNNELSKEEAEALEKSGELAELQAVINTVDQFELKPYAKEAAFAKLDLKPKTKVRKLPVRRILAIAASVLVLIVAGVAILGSSEKVISAPNGETMAFDLPDGSKGVLSPGSAITYTSSIWSENRTYQLDGEAYFEVTSGNDFEVKTQNGNVTVLGTQFNVRAWNKRFVVECYEGKVEMKQRNLIDTLTVGTRVTYADGKKERQPIAQTLPQWQTGEIRFENVETAEVLDEAERLYDIQFDRTLNSSKPLTINLSADSLDKFIDKLILIHQYKVTNLDQKIYRIEE